MAFSIEEFVTAFHNLNGKSVGEKRRSLFQLLHNIPLDHDALLAAIVPKTFLEKLFRIEILIRLQNLTKLLEVLKGEEYFAAKLIKSKWFCQKLAEHLGNDPTNFVSCILPYTSYIIRKRLISKLAIYGTNLDSVFEDIFDRYGIQIASEMLACCSAQKIRSVLEDNNKLDFTPSQAKLLYEKHPTLLITYIEKGYMNADEYIYVLNYIASKDIGIFLKIIQKVDRFVYVGKRLTRKLLLSFKELVIANANKFINFLHIKSAIKTLGNDFKRLYFNCFPESSDRLRYSAYFNKIGPKLGRDFYEVIFEGLTKVYNRTLYDFPDLVSDHMMETMNLEDREKWIGIKRENGCTEIELIKFMRISESIPLIKGKINVTSSINGRCDLVQLLVKTCKINNDLDALGKVEEYVSYRHRNDTLVLEAFLYEIQHCFELESLKTQHFAFINSIMDVLILKGESIYNSHHFAIKYTKILFERNELPDTQIYKLLKCMKANHSWNILTNNKELDKILFLKAIQLAPKLVEQDEKIDYSDLDLIKFIFNWNRKYSEEKLSLFDYPRLVESLNNLLELAINSDSYISELCSVKPIMEFIICTTENSGFRDEVVRKYFLVNFRYYNLKIDRWLMKFQPEIIAANFTSFVKHLTYDYHPDLEILGYIKKYTDFSFPERTVNYCLEQVNLGTLHQVKPLLILAALMSAEDYLQFISPYYPLTNQIASNDDRREKDKVAVSIAKSFKYTNNPIVLATLIEYCKGDFLAYSLESLYYLFYHSPENQLRAFPTTLTSKAVSVRKHAIFLTRLVGTVADVQQLFTHFNYTEENVSVQKHVFTTALKYFINNPADQCFESVTRSMENLNKNDRESVEMLEHLERIPSKYQARYLVPAWKTLKNSADFHENKFRLLRSTPCEIFKELPLDFLLEVVSDNFLNFKSDERWDITINCFTTSSLVNSVHRNVLMDVVFETLTKCKTVKYESSSKERNMFKRISSFVSTFVNQVICEDELRQETLQLFSERWHSLFTATELIEEHLTISFALLYFQSEEDLLKFSTVIAEFLDNLVSTFGVVIVDVFASVLQSCIHSVFSHEDFFNICFFF